MNKPKKIYGVIEEIKVGGDGNHYIKIKDLNTEGKYHIATSGSADNDYGGNEVSEGTRLAFFPQQVGNRVVTPKGKVTIYQDKPKKTYRSDEDFQHSMTVGNAINVASAFCKSHGPEVFEAAEKLVPMINQGRSEMLEEFPEKDVKDISSKYGDALKHAGAYSETLDQIIENAKIWCREAVKLEDKLKG